MPVYTQQDYKAMFEEMCQELLASKPNIVLVSVSNPQSPVIRFALQQRQILIGIESFAGCLLVGPARKSVREQNSSGEMFWLLCWCLPKSTRANQSMPISSGALPRIGLTNCTNKTTKFFCFNL